MLLLENKIKEYGKVLPGNVLKVDNFLNHCVDVNLLSEMAKEFYGIFSGCGVNKILTVEASGIGIAAFTAKEFGCPMLFAKKCKTKNIQKEVYTEKVMSYTHGKVYDIIVSKEYLGEKDRVLIIDDFLASGAAFRGLINICKQAGATVVGCGAVIEKVFQNGGNELRTEGYKVESLAKITAFENGAPVFLNRT